MKGTIFIVDDNEKYKDDIKLFLTKGIRTIGSKDKIETNTKNIICATSLTSVAQFISEGNTLDNLIIQDGFVGNNIVRREIIPEPLKDTMYHKGGAISIDVEATKKVLESTEEVIKNVYMIGINVEKYLKDGNFAKESINILDKQDKLFKYLRLCLEYSNNGWLSKFSLLNKPKSRYVEIAIYSKGE